MSGLVVLDVSRVISGPMAAMLLGDYGARVIKVEHPLKGDEGRELTLGSLSWWTYLSRNKECVTCNLSQPEGRSLFKRLAERADVVVENFRPGTLEKWGLGYADLSKVNRGLVLLRISGFGQTGPYASRPGFGALAEAMSGLVYLTGVPEGPPTLPGVPVADPLAGAIGAFAVMMALWARDREPGSGQGAEIDLSLYAPMLYMLGAHITGTAKTGVGPERGGQLGPKAPRSAVLCKDGNWFTYSLASPGHKNGAVKFMQSRGYMADQLPSSVQDAANALAEAFQQYAKVRDRKTVLEELTAAGIPVAPVNSIPDILTDPILLAREELVTLNNALGEQVTMPRPPARIDSDASSIRLLGNALGEHNRDVYGDWLGLSEQEIGRLTTAGII